MRLLVIFFTFGALAIAQDVRRALPVESSWDETAKFLAGYPLPPEKRYSPLQTNPAGRFHAAEFERQWARYNEYYFTPMRAWSAAELAPRISGAAPLLYFFGGPDAISALALYPMASDYILGGLEPVGALPEPLSLPAGRLEPALANLRGSTDVILSYGHFITKEMKADLDATEFRGVLPVLLTFLGMCGAEVLDVQFFGVDALSGVEKEAGAAGGSQLPGVRVTFRQDPLSAPQRIHYVQANVADGSLRDGLLRWTSGFGKGNVYLKAASYLLHEESFSQIRQFLLGQALSVLQDDSGIPISYFLDGSWRLRFFGTYNGTLEIFKKYHQEALAKAFVTEPLPLPFGTGYKWKRGESNLLLAIRQEPARAEPVNVPPAY